MPKKKEVLKMNDGAIVAMTKEEHDKMHNPSDWTKSNAMLLVKEEMGLF